MPPSIHILITFIPPVQVLLCMKKVQVLCCKFHGQTWITIAVGQVANGHEVSHSRKCIEGVDGFAEVIGVDTRQCQRENTNQMHTKDGSHGKVPSEFFHTPQGGHHTMGRDDAFQGFVNVAQDATECHFCIKMAQEIQSG